MTLFANVKYKLFPAFLAACLVAGAVALPAYGSETGSQTQESTASITFTGGDLLLVSADSIVFEPGTVTSRDTEYDAENAVNIVIADNRGNEDGWQLTAQLGVFTIGEAEALQNATITANDLAITQANTASNTGTPTLSDSVTLISGQAAAPIATAIEGQGAGGWTVTLRQAGIELAVQADTAREGLATAQIDWLIADGA